MFIRLKNDGDEKNIIISSITHFVPIDGGSEIFLINNGSIIVAESNRAIRSAIKKAYATSTDSSEDWIPNPSD